MKNWHLWLVATIGQVVIFGRLSREFDVEVMRDEITVITVESELIDDDILYISISQFNENTHKEFIEATKKIGIIAGVGDRRDEDIKECAMIAARMFDHIIIRQEKHLRGRTEEEINNLILEGIAASGKTVTHEIITKEVEALKHAISSAEDGSFITALSDVITNAIEVVQDYLDKENEEA